jgi:hypothetical protein
MEPHMAEPAYDNPGLTSKQFLEAVRRDPDVPIRLRLKVAEYLLHYFGHECEPASRTPVCTIKIGSIIPGVPDTIELYRDLLYLARCLEQGILPDPNYDTSKDPELNPAYSPDQDLASRPVEGHA